MSGYSDLDFETNPTEPRGHTRVGHTGWIAWIDNGTRTVHVTEAHCTSAGYNARVKTNDGEHDLHVPHGRLQWSPQAALDALAADVREEGERQIKGEQAQIEQARRRIDAIGRGMLFHLIAIGMARHSQPNAKGRIEQSVPGLEETAKSIEYHG